MRRFRIRTVLITGSAALVVLVALIFAALAARDLSTLAASEPDATFALRSKLIDTAFILMAVLLLSSAWVGGRLSARLKSLRAEFVDLARGDRTEPLTRSRFTELDALSVATGRLVQDMRARFELAERRTQAIGELVESGTEGLLHISAAKRIVYANRAARDLMGLPADCEGQSVTALIRQAELRELIGRAVSGETPPPTELALDDRQLVVHCHPLANGRGAAAAILDLTDVRRLEAVRRDFVANVSHELKTPLTSIRGYAETLLGEE
ncbi:MAG TPA: histidine kinase dimerization/phospho-acceptor domain-containing protein, partial [Longimicrobiales bacterium]|nr:histidine kinase dimerization/phospho-acceptor domain-containing protein [Longimicrobiales bacterium]